MAIEIVCYFSTLIRLAKAEATARLSGDKTAYEKAKGEHESYRKLCLKANKMII
jgi:hypothetical protein